MKKRKPGYWSGKRIRDRPWWLLRGSGQRYLHRKPEWR